MWLSVSTDEFKPLPVFARQNPLADRLWQAVNSQNTHLWNQLYHIAGTEQDGLGQMVHFNQIKKEAQRQYMRVLSGTAENWFMEAGGKRRSAIKRFVRLLFGPNRSLSPDPGQMRHQAFLRTLGYCQSTQVLFHFVGLAGGANRRPADALGNDPLYQVQCRIAILGILELLIKRQDFQTALWMGRAAGFVKQVV
jgi:hypothetical protein